MSSMTLIDSDDWSTGSLENGGGAPQALGYSHKARDASDSSTTAVHTNGTTPAQPKPSISQAIAKQGDKRKIKLMQQQGKKPMEHEIKTIKVKLKSFQKKVDTRMSYLEEENDYCCERLAKLEMKQLIEEEKQQLSCLQKQVDLLQKKIDEMKAPAWEKKEATRKSNMQGDDGESYATNRQRSSGTSTKRGKNGNTHNDGFSCNQTDASRRGAGTPNMKQTSDARTTGSNPTTEASSYFSWFLNSTVMLAVAWLLVVVLVMGYAAAVNDRSLFNSAGKDCAGILVFLVTWWYLTWVR